MAAQPSSFPGFLRYVPHGRWAVVGGAFVLGLLLFVVVWLGARERAVALPDPVKPAAAPQAFDPLPGPMPAGAAIPLPAPDESAQLVEEPAPVPPPAPVDATQGPLPPSIETAPAPVAAVQPPARLPDQPAPRYPASALRRGESGTVTIEVEVGIDGYPSAIRVSGRSGSRDLDRAAVEAVSRWRFEPARDAAGQPVPGWISVPIDFKAQ